MYLFLLHFSEKLTKELGMAPGGEFRRAYQEAKNVPGCVVQLGDRPINVRSKTLETLLLEKQKN
jgi:pheromone shutdown protein TraB